MLYHFADILKLKFEQKLLFYDKFDELMIFI